MLKVNIGDHEHRVSTVNHRNGLECDVCDRPYCRGYYCSECKFKVHEKCSFLFKTQVPLRHPSHDGHPLKFLTTGAPDHTDPRCHICGKNTKCLVYHCSICKQNLDIDCMIDAMCARANLDMPWHRHPLLIIDISGLMLCDICGGNSKSAAYFCPRCRLVVHDHEECVSVLDSPAITHPSHPRHPLKLLTDVPDYADSECHMCGEYIDNLLYHCEICKFNLHIVCAKRKPPVAVSDLKVHEHTLTLMPRLISFVCDACGTKGDRAPYVCLQCDFMIHQDCSRLPRVIHVNRHDHRVAYTYPLGPGQWKCGVCWEEIDWSCGAYSCPLCPNFAVHSRCATREDVWDGEELDGVPEDVEDIEPFKMNDDNTITHFAHEHNLNLRKDGIALDESILCGACVGPLGSNTFYNCSQCHFTLHEVCANLPKKKRHFLSASPFILQPNMTDTGVCGACRQYCFRGFFYTDGIPIYDLLCSSITEPFAHDCHPHPLLYIKGDRYDHVMIKTCKSCGIDIEDGRDVLGCIKCNFFLDFRCATLPLTTRLERYDDHPLILCYGDEKASGKYWCDICERQTNPDTWFYTCKDCGVTLHVLCVLWDLRYAKEGEKREDDLDVEVLLNNTSSRPLCDNCHTRCPGHYVLKACKRTNVFFCSSYCHRHFQYNNYSWIVYGLCPPWAYEPKSLKEL